jgi:transglutaminase-like putative cysteine protease
MSGTIDWSAVGGADIRVRHHYRYVYTAPISALTQQLIMIPPDRHLDQRLLSHDMQVRGVSGATDLELDTDPMGNRVCRVQAERVEHAVDFEAVFSVRRVRPRHAEQAHHVSRSELRAYLGYTSLTAPDARLRAAADEIRAGAPTLFEQAERAHDWAAQAITYQVGVTGVQTPAAMALHLGQGVCQDYAHILLALLRLLGVPCRYVSGHLLGEGPPHAWVEVLLPQSRTGVAVVAFDPTHHRRAGLNYVTVAVGRDFADVTMTSGVFSGAASGRLHWSKQADIVELMTAEEVAEAAA